MANLTGAIMYFHSRAQSSISLPKLVFNLTIVGISTILASSESQAQSLGLERVSNSFVRPVFATYAPGDSNRLFVVEQHSGNIEILDLTTGATNANPFITISPIDTGNEQGLLGLAFHPDYQNNGYFFVNYTDASGTTRIRRYTASGPDTADVSSAMDVISIPQPQSNHNGGWIGFGSDGDLYVATGDGGASNDNGSGHTTGIGNSQDTTSNLLGKMLRLDIDGDDFPGDNTRNYAIPPTNPFVGAAGDDEIFAYGLRNPYRSSFDRQTGNMVIADVGQNLVEEIDVILAGSTGGENFGWRPREGVFQTPGSVGGAKPPGAIDPIYNYMHGSGDLEGRSVTGGYVYRGPLSLLDGHYFFGDFVNNRMWSFKLDGTTDPLLFDGTNFTQFIDWTDILTTDVGSLNNISSFAEDEAGNMYVISLSGSIFRFASGSVPATMLEQGVTYGGSSFAETEFAPDKFPLSPGQTATFANYTSYSRGLNRVAFDIQGIPSTTLASSDFEFRVGNNDDPSTWTVLTSASAIPLPTITVGTPVNNVSQVLLAWPDNAIENAWLQVVVLDTPDTGLSSPETFYFGNAIGETGNDAADTRVNLSDVGLTRGNQTGFSSAPIDNNYDFDRDGRVNLVDVGICRTNQSGFSSLELISPPANRNQSDTKDELGKSNSSQPASKVVGESGRAAPRKRDSKTKR
jgi:glucose/arabinose dehydrogenase